MAWDLEASVAAAAAASAYLVFDLLNLANDYEQNLGWNIKKEKVAVVKY